MTKHNFPHHHSVFRGKGYFIKMGLCDQTMHLAKLVSRRLSPARSILVPTPMLDEFSFTGRPALTFTGRPSSTFAHELAMMAGVEDTQPLEVWHLRLGHLNQSAIQQLTTRAHNLKVVNLIRRDPPLQTNSVP